jgi:hypothetical protein
MNDIELPGFRIDYCKKCNKLDMIDKTDLCLSCACTERPELASILKEFQRKEKEGEK